MKKILFASWLLVISVGLATTQAPNVATFDPTTGQYVLEDRPKIVVAVESDTFGQALVDLWNSAHPEAPDVVRYVKLSVDDAFGQISDLTWDAPDVILGSGPAVLAHSASVAILDGNLTKLVNENVVHELYKEANAPFKEVTALPFAYEGLVFAWNKKMLTDLGYDVGPTNAVNLPGAFDSWEKIFALSREWQTKRPVYLGRPVDVVFPLAIDDLWAGYSSTTAGGWEIFKESDPTKPGFEKTEFLKGLEFIKAASDAKIAVDANEIALPGKAMAWNWNDILKNQTAPFNLIGTELGEEDLQALKAQDVRFAAMPTWKGTRLTPLVRSKVVVLSSTSVCPSAASELLRLIFSKEGMQAVVDSSPYLPDLRPDAKILPDFTKSPIKQQMTAALAFSVPEPFLLGQSGATLPSIGVLYTGDLSRALAEVWNGTKSPAEGQASIVALADRWNAQNHGN